MLNYDVFAYNGAFYLRSSSKYATTAVASAVAAAAAGPIRSLGCVRQLLLLTAATIDS
jgi:hypothetical protein